MNRSFWAAGELEGPVHLDGVLRGDDDERVGEGWVSPSTVTCPSIIASKSAAWVFGGARLISSASTTFANTGPGWNSKLWVSSSKTFEPMTSDGNRSG